MVADVLSLTPDQVRVVGATALVAIHVFDVLASADGVPGNTPREWLIRLSQWRSLGFYDAANRRRAKEEGQWRLWLAPFHYLPMTGAIVPFFCGGIVGHSFHPWSKPPFELGWWGLGGMVLLGLGISVTTYAMGRAEQPRGERLVAWFAAFGLVAAVFLWPVT